MLVKYCDKCKKVINTHKGVKIDKITRLCRFDMVTQTETYGMMDVKELDLCDECLEQVYIFINGNGKEQQS